MPEGACAGGIAIVIDVLRASTTIVTALAHRATRVRPVRTVGEARALAGQANVLLGGERGGQPIEGFDLGNSPLEYTQERVAGRDVVFTTTNGTAALHACGDAADVLVGGVVNRSAVAALVLRLANAEHRDIHLVCAGTDGGVTEEDLLGAGAILAAAIRLGADEQRDLDAPARAAVADFRAVEQSGGDPATALACVFATSVGGRNLITIGMEHDLAPAAAIDALPVVPRLDRATGWLVGDRSAEGLLHSGRQRKER
ncbi:MAG: 2-phosphosulfolactate phosphatase [Planctomycetota bacterium]|nr:2-phosphosulfolactate phosphatase [Planctomycetota bacterium]